MEKMCEFKNCKETATKKGYVYGHPSDSDDYSDSSIPVISCDKHAKHPSFFSEGDITDGK